MNTRIGIAVLLLLWFMDVHQAPANDVPNTSYGGTTHLVRDGNAMALSNKGLQLMNSGRSAEAVKYFTTAIERDPNAYLLRYNRAVCYTRMSRWGLALEDLNSCTRLKPTYSAGFFLRAVVNDRLGNFTASLADFDSLVKAHPDDWGIRDARASLLATCPDSSVRNGPAAINEAMTVCKMSNWVRAEFIDTLAAAYAEAGDFDAAIRFEQKAIDRARGAKGYTSGMERRLVLYQKHQPYRESLGTASRDRSKSANLAGSD